QPPTSPAFTNVSALGTWLRVEDEKFQYQSAEFQAFEVNNRCHWHRISRVIKQLEDLFETYDIPNAMVNGANPRALRHIRKYIAGRPALIVPGVGGHPDDFAVGDALGIPVFGSTPAITNLFLLQSTSRRMVAQLAEADANNEEEGESSRHPVGNVLSPRTSVLLTTVLRKTSIIAKERRHKLSEVARTRTSRISLSPRIDFDLINQPRREVVQPPGDFDMFTLDKVSCRSVWYHPYCPPINDEFA
ncbi:hypothetical protein AHF37_10779, partial [Paragonimus kellicotti]